jgi:DNA topoisomerase-3
MLKSVYRGETAIEKVIDDVGTELSAIIQRHTGDVEAYKTDKEIIGSCPVCGKPIYEGGKSFYCSGYKDGCKFVFWKSNRFLESMGKKEITPAMAKSLLLKGKVLVKGLKSKARKTFDAFVTVKFEEINSNFGLEFQKKMRL